MCYCTGFPQIFVEVLAQPGNLHTIKQFLRKALMATYSRQLLSRHTTTATYGGQEEGRESMLKVRQ